MDIVKRWKSFDAAEKVVAVFITVTCLLVFIGIVVAIIQNMS